MIESNDYDKGDQEKGNEYSYLSTFIRHRQSFDEDPTDDSDVKDDDDDEDTRIDSRVIVVVLGQPDEITKGTQ